MRPDKYLASKPIKLNFAGWESDTWTLQQHGWQLSVSQDHMYRGIQIGMQHPEYRMRGISRLIEAPLYMHEMHDPYTSMYSSYTVPAQLGSDFISHTASIAPFASYQPIDAEPQFMERTERMSEMMPFAPNLARTQEIIIPEHSVEDMLNMILEKQAPNREELIRRRVREQGQMVDFNARTQVHAQIISVAG